MKNPTNLQVANTILQQLGGRRFLAMTGAHNLVATNDSLSMKLRRNKSKANYLKIELDVTDTYTMKFIQFRAGKTTVLKEHDGVYFDMLQGLFTDFTGMYTKL